MGRYPHRALTLAALWLFTAGCERGCAREWFADHGVGSEGRRQPGSAQLNAVDCPDGLARCSDGIVEASRLSMIPQPCRGGAEQCRCPWERIAECDRGCVVEGLDAVMEKAKAAVQLCAPASDAGPFASPVHAAAPGPCEEGELYGCRGGVVVACAERAVVGTCVAGCSVEGGALDGDVPVSREAAFAILCSR